MPIFIQCCGTYILCTVFNTNVSAYAGIEPRTVAVYALIVRAATTKLHLIHPKFLFMIAGIQLILVFNSGELRPFFECAAALLSSRSCSLGNDSWVSLTQKRTLL